MGERLNQFKSNFQENVAVKHVKSHKKEYYIGVGFVVCVASAYFLGQHKASTVITTNTASACSGGTATINNAGRDMITHNYAPNRLSYIVTDGENWWDTQAAAAKALGERASDISNHLNHGVDLKSGAKLSRKGIRS